MTPKEKAIELVDRFMLRIILNVQSNINFSVMESAKECAILSVDEIISACEYNNVEFYNTQWWNKVKEEINKL